MKLDVPLLIKLYIAQVGGDEEEDDFKRDALQSLAARRKATRRERLQMWAGTTREQIKRARAIAAIDPFRDPRFAHHSLRKQRYLHIVNCVQRLMLILLDQDFDPKPKGGEPLELSVRMIDRRAQIRESRGYIGQAGPPPKNQIGPRWLLPPGAEADVVASSLPMNPPIRGSHNGSDDKSLSPICQPGNSRDAPARLRRGRLSRLSRIRSPSKTTPAGKADGG